MAAARRSDKANARILKAFLAITDIQYLCLYSLPGHFLLMCGIIGYVGQRKASEVLTEGLKHLEYRGYDSVGIAVLRDKTLEIKKDKGMVEEVSSSMRFTSLDGTVGIGHTR